MKELSLVERIKRWFGNHPDIWYNGGQLEEMAMTIGYKASNASRRLRELAEQNILQREERRNGNTRIKSVWYKLHTTL